MAATKSRTILTIQSRFTCSSKGSHPMWWGFAYDHILRIFQQPISLVLSFPVPRSMLDLRFGNTGANANVSQRIRFGFEVQFTSASLISFPPPGSTAPNAYTLSAAINIPGQAVPSLPGEFFLLGGDDPYFTNVNASAGNQPYLSQDLRVFTITPTANNQTPIGNVPFNFTSGGSPTTFDHPAAYTYIQDLITWLNQNYGYLNTTVTRRLTPTSPILWIPCWAR